MLAGEVRASSTGSGKPASGPWAAVECFHRPTPDLTHIQLHKNYGCSMLLGPNFVSLNDPDYIWSIYRDGRFLKVIMAPELIDVLRSRRLKCNRVRFTRLPVVLGTKIGSQIISVQQTLRNTKKSVRLDLTIS